MPNPDFVAELRCNGQKYTGWTSLTVKRQYGDNAVTAFQFAATESVPAQGSGSATGIRCQPGDAVKVYLAGIKVVDGYVTDRQTAYDANSHDVVIAGMSKTVDLAAGSMPLKRGSLHGYTFQQATNLALSGTGVSLVVKNTGPTFGKPFNSLNIDPGETRFQFIDKLARMRGLFLTDDADGNLVCNAGNPTGQAGADLAEGVNILRARATLSDQSAWSTLSMYGQNTDPNADGPPRAVSATATGGPSRADRQRVCTAEHPCDSEDAKVRLGLEVARSLWPQVECTIVVVGWKRPDGSLWDVLGTVNVKSRKLFPNASGSLTLGVQSVTFSKNNEEGTLTELVLVRPEALTSLGHPGIQSDAQGNIVNSPAPTPQADPPDYQAGGSSNTDAPL